MANFRVPFLVERKPARGGASSWYWQPSAALARAGWKPLALGKNFDAALKGAQARNAEVDAWQNGGAVIAQVKKRVATGTIEAGIARYRREVIEGKKPNGQPMIAASTAKTYRTALDRLDRWAGPHPIAFVTRPRVKALKTAMMQDPAKGGIGHHAAHQTLKMGRALWRFLVDEGLAETNPFEKFGLAAPDPRSVIWSPPAREAMIMAALDANQPSIALAIMLGFAIGQREADLLALTPARYVAIPEHKMQPEDYELLAKLAPADGPFAGRPSGIRIRQNKTGAWIEVPVVGTVRALLEHTIDRARAAGLIGIILDDTRGPALYSGPSGQTRFQRDFAEIRDWAIAAATSEGEPELATELATLHFADLRRTCVVYLGELGMDAHLIAAVTGHDLDDTQRILKTYMPRTTGRAARAISLAAAREAKEAQRASEREEKSA